MIAVVLSFLPAEEARALPLIPAAREMRMGGNAARPPGLAA